MLSPRITYSHKFNQSGVDLTNLYKLRNALQDAREGVMEENNRLQEEMSVCKCNISDQLVKKIHDDAARLGTRTYKDIGLFLARMVCNALQPARDKGKIHKVEKNQQRAAREGKTVPWPRSPRDVLPYGVDDSIGALAVWIEFGFTHIAYLSLFTSIVDLFKKEAVPAILASPTLPGKFVSIAESPFKLLAHPGRAPGDWLPEIMAEIKLVAGFCDMLGTYFDKDESRVLHEKVIEQSGYNDPERSLLHICRIGAFILPRLAEPVPPRSQVAADIQQCIELFTSMGGIWHGYMDLPYDVEKYGPTIVALARRRSEIEKYPVFMAYQGFIHLSCWERCWSPGCRQTFAGAGRAFAACSECRRVTYCSKECLARAWRHEDAPHRAVCKKIKYIVDATDLDPKPSMPGARQFQTVCEVRKVDQGPLVEFGSHMVKLRELMSLAPRKT